MSSKATTFVPDRGDVIWGEFTPHAGHEQGGRRPGLVLTTRAYNATTGRMLCCPISSRDPRFPTDVPLPPEAPVQGVIMADQVRTFDWKARHAKLAGKVSEDIVFSASTIIRALLT